MKNRFVFESERWVDQSNQQKIGDTSSWMSQWSGSSIFLFFGRQFCWSKYKSLPEPCRRHPEKSKDTLLGVPHIKKQNSRSIMSRGVIPKIMGYQDCEQTFPFVLFDMLETAAARGIRSISWVQKGTRFMVYNRDLFMIEVMPFFFSRQTQFKSFQRQLNLYGFTRTKTGPFKGKPHEALHVWLSSTRIYP